MKIIEELLEQECKLFDTPATLDAALDYVVQYAKGSSDPAAVTACVQIVLNTIAHRLREDLADEPYTPYNTVNS